MNVFLSSQAAYPWTAENGFFFRGYFLAEGQCWRGSSAVSFLKKHLDVEPPETVFRGLNGVFSVIWERGSDVLFAVDRLRGLPLFYSIVSGELWVGDDTVALVETLPEKSLSAFAEEEFKSTNTFVSGSSTLLNELFQVRAGEFCVFDNKKAVVESVSYFCLKYRNSFNGADSETLCREFYLAYSKAGKSLVKALNGRTAVIPLSGGADSRMVLSLLKNEHYEKVLCFSYGRPGNPESEISRQVAKEFGYSWTMVPYSGKMWETLRDDPATADYEKFASAYCSTPHLQDFPAVKYMKEHGDLPEDSVFLPGHMGDEIAGSSIPTLYLNSVVTRQDCTHSIFNKFYHKVSPALQEHIIKSYKIPNAADAQEYASVFERFNFSERQAKYIINSVRVYEFFGYEWLIPLGDNDLFDFWEKVPLLWQCHRKLYFFAVNDQLPSTNDITVSKRLASKVRQIPGLRSMARKYKRIQNYWSSPLCIEHFFPAPVYWKACIFGSTPVSSTVLGRQRLLTQLKEELRRHEES